MTCEQKRCLFQFQRLLWCNKTGLSNWIGLKPNSVILATNPTLCPLVQAHGVRCKPVGLPVDMGVEGTRLLAQSFNNVWIDMIRVMQLGACLVEQAYPEVLQVCRGVDLVVTSGTTSGIAEAEQLGLPWISVTLQPARVPVKNQPSSLVNRLVWGVLGRLFVTPTNRFRKRVGAPPVKDISTMMSSPMILLPVGCRVAFRCAQPGRPSHHRPVFLGAARIRIRGWTEVYPPQPAHRCCIATGPGAEIGIDGDALKSCSLREQHPRPAGRVHCSGESHRKAGYPPIKAWRAKLTFEGLARQCCFWLCCRWAYTIDGEDR
jgi:hypothetical protein